MEQTATVQTATQALAKSEGKYNKIKSYMRSEEIMSRFIEVLGSYQAQSYISSVLIAVGNSTNLQNCSPQSIVVSAMRAATLKLSVDPSLGQAHLVPFGKDEKAKATLVIGYKGLRDMAYRTGKYAKLNVADIYAGQTVVEDQLTGDIRIEGIPEANHKEIGYCLYFRLRDGFEKFYYMSVEEIKAHAQKYSPGYRSQKYDNAWVTNFEDMCRKTVLRLGLNHWGVMSAEDKMVMSMGTDENDMPAEDEVHTKVVVKSEKQIMRELGFEDENTVEGHFQESDQETDSQPTEQPELNLSAEKPLRDIRLGNWKENYPPVDYAFSLKTSDGKLYCDLTVPELSNRFNSLTKTVKANPDDTISADKAAICKALIDASL